MPSVPASVHLSTKNTFYDDWDQVWDQAVFAFRSLPQHFAARAFSSSAHDHETTYHQIRPAPCLQSTDSGAFFSRIYIPLHSTNITWLPATAISFIQYSTHLCCLINCVTTTTTNNNNSDTPMLQQQQSERLHAYKPVWTSQRPTNSGYPVH